MITGDKLVSWDIYIEGPNNKLNNKVIKDNLNLTGCLTLADIKVLDINIISNNTSCEDSVNLIRVTGTINNVSISNSNSDGIDLDFSEVKINNMKFKNILNDCVDMSFGSYKINKIQASGCGDKGVSVGEKTNLFLKDIELENANIGLAAKDSSTAVVEESNIINTPICFASYRKKQEFSGSTILIKSTNCRNDKMSSQIGSKITLGL